MKDKGKNIGTSINNNSKYDKNGKLIPNGPSLG